LYKSIWIQYAKSRTEIRKQKKEKEERRKINKRASGERFGPEEKPTHSPGKKNPNRYSSLPLPR
jgi:hypothetical protein